jgi:hypothetical protein
MCQISANAIHFEKNHQNQLHFKDKKMQMQVFTWNKKKTSKKKVNFKFQ